MGNPKKLEESAAEAYRVQLRARDLISAAPPTMAGSTVYVRPGIIPDKLGRGAPVSMQYVDPRSGVKTIYNCHVLYQKTNKTSLKVGQKEEEKEEKEQ